MLSAKCSRGCKLDQGKQVNELYEVVSQIPALLGRLIYIACLWNPQTRRYDRGLPARFLGVQADEALGCWHRSLFFQWLSQSWMEKQADVALYWSSIGGSRGQIEAIRELAEAAIPPHVNPEERRAFIKDLALAQGSL